jgi:CBS domain-containing protein
MRVTELMSKPAYTCNVNDSAVVAAQIMWDRDCGVVPIVDDGGRICGVVTDRDLCMAALFKGKPLSEIPVSDAMSHEVFACHPDDDIAKAEHLMGAQQVHRLPVIDDHQSPVGMLSLSDVVRRLGHPGISRQEEGRDFVETMAAICQPRKVTHH